MISTVTRNIEWPDYLIFRYNFDNLDNLSIFAKEIVMRVIAKKTLVLFYTKHEDAETALEDWYEKTENSN